MKYEDLNVLDQERAEDAVLNAPASELYNHLDQRDRQAYDGMIRRAAQDRWEKENA